MSRQIGKQLEVDKWIEQIEKDGGKVTHTKNIDQNRKSRGFSFDWVGFHYKLFGCLPE